MIRPGTVISPYWLEPREMIARCILSVASQTMPVYHTLVADGAPQEWFDKYIGLKHLKLAKHHGDWGNTPRRFAMIADYGSPFIAFLDADNWYDPDHIETCLAAAKANPGCDFVASRERFVRSCGTPSSAKHEPQDEHIDFNELVLFPSAYDTAIHALETIPKGNEYHGDRWLYACLKRAGLKPAFTNRETLTYVIANSPKWTK